MYFSHDRNGIDGESGKDESMTQTKKKRGRPAGSKNSRSNPKAKEKAMEIQNKRKADRRVMDEIWSIIAIALGRFPGSRHLDKRRRPVWKSGRRLPQGPFRICRIYTAVLSYSVRHTFVCEKSCFDLCKNCTAAHTPPLHGLRS